MANLAANTPELMRRIAELQQGVAADDNFHWLFKRYYRVVFYHLVRTGLSTEHAEDLTQETFFRVFRAVGQFRGEASFATWLLRIAHNLRCKSLRDDHGRERNRTWTPVQGPKRDTEAQAGALEIGGPQPGPLEEAIAAERCTLLRRELEELPPQMRRCILMRVEQGLKYREIASILQISIDTVKSQLHQAKARLKERLSEGLLSIDRARFGPQRRSPV